MICKCVCKPWLDLLVTPEFIKSHLSKSAPGIVVFEQETHSRPYKIVEFVNKLDFNCHEHRWNVVFDFGLPFHRRVHSSTSGLLFFCEGSFHGRDISLCNPITREYIRLPFPLPLPRPWFKSLNYGFGVNKTSGECKVVRILSAIGEIDCQVYTVGTGFWRKITCGSLLEYEVQFKVDSKGALLNGKLHFLASIHFSYRVSCLDLETELFSTFSPPPPSESYMDRNLSVLGDCLCVCATASVFGPDYEIHIWLMMEYGDDESWTKEFIIRKVGVEDCLGSVRPIKVFEDGDILMESQSRQLAYYSTKTNAIRRVDVSGFNPNIWSCADVYVPSFLPLKVYVMENVSSF